MKKLWFKAKRYGWGWRPCSWEGWTITLLYLVGVLLLVLYARESLVLLLSGVIVLIIIMIVVGFLTGERPKWSWGN